MKRLSIMSLNYISAKGTQLLLSIGTLEKKYILITIGSAAVTIGYSNNMLDFLKVLLGGL